MEINPWSRKIVHWIVLRIRIIISTIIPQYRKPRYPAMWIRIVFQSRIAPRIAQYRGMCLCNAAHFNPAQGEWARRNNGSAWQSWHVSLIYSSVVRVARLYMYIRVHTCVHTLRCGRAAHPRVKMRVHAGRRKPPGIKLAREVAVAVAAAVAPFRRYKLIWLCGGIIHSTHYVPYALAWMQEYTARFPPSPSPFFCPLPRALFRSFVCTWNTLKVPFRVISLILL